MTTKGQPSTNRLCLDFDGVIHNNRNVPEGRKMGMPIEGALAAVKELQRRFDVIIFTARAGPYQYIDEWLRYFGFPALRVTNVKLPAIAYIDDHGLHFQSWPQALEDLQRLEPWLRHA